LIKLKLNRTIINRNMSNALAHQWLFLLCHRQFKNIILSVSAFNLVACSTSNINVPRQPHLPETTISKTGNHYICQNPSSYKNKEKVLSLPSGSISPGSIIATFKNGNYPNVTGYHAAIYISHDKNGIWVWDQWVGKPVHKRLIRIRKDKATASNSAQEYRLVK